MTDYPLARRTLMTSASLSIGAGLASAIAPLRPQVAAAEPAPVDIWSSEYWAHKGEVRLNLWRKRLGAWQLDKRRAARLLPPAAERRSPVRDLAANSTRRRFQLQSTPALVRDEEFSRRAGAGRGEKLVKERRRSPSLVFSNAPPAPGCHAGFRPCRQD